MTTWLEHVKKTYAAEKKKNSSIKLKDALKIASKTWKKNTTQKKGGKTYKLNGKIEGTVEDEEEEEEEAEEEAEEEMEFESKIDKVEGELEELKSAKPSYSKFGGKGKTKKSKKTKKAKKSKRARKTVKGGGVMEDISRIAGSGNPINI